MGKYNKKSYNYNKFKFSAPKLNEKLNYLTNYFLY